MKKLNRVNLVQTVIKLHGYYLEKTKSLPSSSGRGGFSGGYNGYYGGGYTYGKWYWGIKKEETAFAVRYTLNVEDLWQLIHDIYISHCDASWNFKLVSFSGYRFKECHKWYSLKSWIIQRGCYTFWQSHTSDKVLIEIWNFWLSNVCWVIFSKINS